MCGSRFLLAICIAAMLFQGIFPLPHPRTEEANGYGEEVQSPPEEVDGPIREILRQYMVQKRNQEIISAFNHIKELNKLFKTG